MDYIGISIYSKTIYENQMFRDLGIDAEDLGDAFKGLLKMVDSLATRFSTEKRPLGVTIHLCDIAMLKFDWVREPWLDAVRTTRLSHPLEVGYHINFAHENLPIAPGFVNTFKDAMDMCRQLGAKVCVMHAPLMITKDTDADFAALMACDDVLDAMGSNDTVLCWENAQDTPAPYRFLDALLGWRRRLNGVLEQKGRAEFINRHQFCLDTGHLLVSLQRDGAASDQVTKYLPEFAKNVRVFHLHANDGSKDQHLTPLLMCSQDRLGPGKIPIDQGAFLKNSEIVLDWMATCDRNATLDARHVHLEVDVPTSIASIERFYKRYFGI
nr:TIM barrel protein [Candidatus Sigynarchaeota archaeon]